MDHNPATVYIGLGSNLGDRQKNIDDAIQMLAQLEGTRIVKSTDSLQTKPLGPADQNDFLNAAAKIQTILEPKQLLDNIKNIEKKLGRKNTKRWGPRSIDIDILLYNDQIINTEHLTIPHPQMHLRTFVLDSLCRLDPDIIHPLLGLNVKSLKSRLNGNDYYINTDNPLLISIAGVIGAGKTTLADAIYKQAETSHTTPDKSEFHVLYEPYGQNPYLEKVYAGQNQFALDSQLFFLVNRSKQLNRFTLKKNRCYITDYLFDKELIYAKRLLDPDQLAEYEVLYAPFATQVVTPSLVLFLTDTPENCLAKILRRNRPYEQNIKLQFLSQMTHDYQTLLKKWDRSPVITIDASKVDITARKFISDINKQICYYIGL
jgi:2-amino-4-hydroxy-6-hydroxymethyldihydropteridine diphosphokinase